MQNRRGYFTVFTPNIVIIIKTLHSWKFFYKYLITKITIKLQYNLIVITTDYNKLRP